jgi:hypothetical protein
MMVSSSLGVAGFPVFDACRFGARRLSERGNHSGIDWEEAKSLCLHDAIAETRTSAAHL